MPDLRHPEAEKLYSAIKKYGNEQAAAEIAGGMSLSLSATKEERAKWVNYISAELEKRFDQATVKAIRMSCYCTENGKLDETKKWLRRLYLDSGSLEEFVDKVNERSAGWYIVDGALHTKMFGCECPMLAGVELLPSKTWCYCTVGYSKAIFDYVFGCEVDIELLASSKLGDEVCLLRVMKK